MHELIPGLVAVAEERLGKLGRPLTTLVILFACLGVIFWGASLVFKEGVAPLLEFLGSDVANTPAAVLALNWAALVGFFSLIGLLIIYWRNSNQTRRIQTKRQRIQELEAELASLRVTPDGPIQ